MNFQLISLYMYAIIPLSSQTSGFKAVGELNMIFGLLVSIIFILSTVIIFVYKQYNNKVKEILNIHEDYSEKMRKLNLNNEDKLERIRERIDRTEEDRNKQWIESEKETLQVLNGVTHVLEVSEKMERVDSQNILDKINQLEINLKTFISSK